MEDEDLAFKPARPALVSLAAFTPSSSPSPRRLSSNFIQPSRPVMASRRLSWLSLEGRLIGAQEATSAKAIGGGMGKEEAVAWELFKPIHRVLIVAVVAAAAAESRKNGQISQLRRSVAIRDQVLSSMQQKLDDLCEQMNSVKDRPETDVDKVSGESKFCSCGCQICESVISNFKRDAMEKESSSDENFKMLSQTNMNVAYQEERRMSDLSDWCSSVASGTDIQLNALAIEQDIYNLQKECEEKDATIKELASLAKASDIAGSKRTAELEDIIRRKNMVITKLKKDMMILEQKVLQLTRQRRPSFSAMNSIGMSPPVMATNLLYDMDSSTSLSSSDSDCPIKHREPRPKGSAFRKHQDVLVSHEDQDIHCKEEISERKNQKLSPANVSVSSSKSKDGHPKQRSLSPLKEKSLNQRADSSVPLRPRRTVSSADSKRNRRHIPPGSKDTAPHKRWV